MGGPSCVRNTPGAHAGSPGRRHLLPSSPTRLVTHVAKVSRPHQKAKAVRRATDKKTLGGTAKKTFGVKAKRARSCHGAGPPVLAALPAGYEVDERSGIAVRRGNAGPVSPEKVARG